MPCEWQRSITLLPCAKSRPRNKDTKVDDVKLLSTRFPVDKAEQHQLLVTGILNFYLLRGKNTEINQSHVQASMTHSRTCENKDPWLIIAAIPKTGSQAFIMQHPDTTAMVHIRWPAGPAKIDLLCMASFKKGEPSELLQSNS